jgi:hypothetical protein
MHRGPRTWESLGQFLMEVRKVACMLAVHWLAYLTFEKEMEEERDEEEEEEKRRRKGKTRGNWP